MPKKEIDYSKCCIYKREHIDNENLIYVGHTTNFKQRKADHKLSCNNNNKKEFNRKLYQMIRENDGWEMFKMIELEKYPCNDRREAEKKEDEILKELKATMNTNRAQRTSKQYNEDNKDKIKKYREDNKEKTKQYYENNKDKIKEYQKQYKENNKEILKVRKKELIFCSCGYEVNKYSLKRHQTSEKHIHIMNNQSL